MQISFRSLSHGWPCKNRAARSAYSPRPISGGRGEPGKKSKRASSIGLDRSSRSSIIHRSISRGRALAGRINMRRHLGDWGEYLAALLSALIDRFESHGSRRPFEFQMRDRGSNMTILVAVFNRPPRSGKKGGKQEND